MCLFVSMRECVAGVWKICLKIGRCGDWETEDRKLEVIVSLRKLRGGSPASAHRLSVGLVRKAPRASLRAEDWTVSSCERADLLARL